MHVFTNYFFFELKLVPHAAACAEKTATKPALPAQVPSHASATCMPIFLVESLSPLRTRELQIAPLFLIMETGA